MTFLSQASKSILQSSTLRHRVATSAISATGFAAVSSSSITNVSPSNNNRQYTTYSQLPEEHQMIHEMCRKFADEELAPNAREWDQKHVFPQDAVSKLVRNQNRERERE